MLVAVSLKLFWRFAIALSVVVPQSGLPWALLPALKMVVAMTRKGRPGRGVREREGGFP